MSVNALIASAVGEKLAEEYLAARAARGSRAAFKQALAKVPPAQPEEPDRLE